MRVEIDGKLYNTVPANHRCHVPYTTGEHIECEFMHSICDGSAYREACKSGVIFLNDENFTQWLAARLRS